MRRWIPVAAIAARACWLSRRSRNRRHSKSRSSSIGVGGKPLFYYLPLTIAERQGYFKAEGLDVEIQRFPRRCARAAGAARRQRRHRVGRLRAHDLAAGEGPEHRGADPAGQVRRHRARDEQGEGREVQVAEGSQGHEDRRHRAGLVDQHVRQHPAREGRPQARRRRDHRRRRDGRRGRDHEARRDRRDRPISIR